MSELGKPEQAAIEAVARHFTATREEGEVPSNAVISIGGKRIAVEVTIIEQRITDRTDLNKPRLRFDKVALRLISRLQGALRESMPDGTTVILTITAPIRLPSKTAAALEDNIRDRLVRRSTQVQWADTIQGNEIRVRLVKSSPRQNSKLVGLVHNPDSDPDMLLDVTQSLLQHIGAAADRRAPAGSARERWLVLVNKGGFSHIETYRQIYGQLSIPNDFTKILMLSAGGRVETLTG
jgi:hypothetical protein